MEYFLKDSYHTLLCSLGFVGDLLGSAFSPWKFYTNLCPVYYSTSANPLFWEAMMSHRDRAIIFFSFALLNLSPFSSSPLVGGNCPKVSEMKGNFTWNMNSVYIQGNCSLKFLREIRKLCEVNVIGKNVWFIQILSLFYYFHSSTRHYSITSSLIIF